MKTCKSCKNLFKPSRNSSLYCSRSCYLQKHSENTKKCKCKNCGKLFKTEKNRLDNGRGIYCGRRCADKGKKFIRKRVIRYCEICNKKFDITPLRIKKYGYGKFCGQECFKRHREKLISFGEWHFNTNHKHGHYTSKMTGNKEFYESSYELKRMNQLDEMNVIWTKKHGIRINYTDKNNKNRCYIPDFLIENKIIEEIKPFVMLTKENNPLKFKAAKKYCKINHLQFRIITEKELEIKI